MTVVRVPGSWELPGAAAQAAKTGNFDAIVALGCLIRGDTLHYELIAGQTAGQLAALQAEAGLPVVFGVLTTDTLEQAMDRAGAKCGNKGAEAAVTAVEMVHVYQALAKPRRGGAKRASVRSQPGHPDAARRWPAGSSAGSRGLPRRLPFRPGGTPGLRDGAGQLDGRAGERDWRDLRGPGER